MDTDQDPSTNHRQSILLKTSRRSTFLARPLDQSEPVYENPNNTPERNHELQQEYNNLQALNRTLGNISDNLEKTKFQLSHFNDTINGTNGLLDMWLKILEKTEETKALIENPDWHGSSPSVKLMNCFYCLYP
ncbi:DASH complex subunit Duo1-domain-containing protein [Thamnidium elegans]|nr:DASH complex subunit Duo1-domain-containing protein [Thamnidium elegans]